MTDEELVRQYKETRNMELLGEVFRRYMDMLYGVCLKYLKDAEEAKDAVMQIFELLVARIDKHEVEHFRGWIYVFAKHHCLMQIRSGKKMKKEDWDDDIVQFEEPGHPENKQDRDWQLDQLAVCIDQLPQEQQVHVRMFYLQEKSYKEIASTTGEAWNKVRSHIQNGRRNLKNCMEKKLKIRDDDHPQYDLR